MHCRVDFLARIVLKHKTLKTNSKFAPENRVHPKRIGLYSNHPFSGANWLLVSGRVKNSMVSKAISTDGCILQVKAFANHERLYDVALGRVPFPNKTQSQRLGG